MRQPARSCCGSWGRVNVDCRQPGFGEEQSKERNAGQLERVAKRQELNAFLEVKSLSAGKRFPDR
jgi:hypothetical protein